MNKILLILLTLSFVKIFSQSESELPSTKFSIEFAYRYNGLNQKHGPQIRSHFWFLQKNSIGPELHTYFPTPKRKYLDFQIDINFRRIIVDFHPITFDVLIGPGFRSTRDSINQDGEFIRPLYEYEKRHFLYDGINLGFGMGYRFENHSLFIMPRINHKSSAFQFSFGYKYHFNIYLDETMRKRYNLRTKPKKD